MAKVSGHEKLEDAAALIAKHAGILVVEQRRGQPVSELARLIHDLVSDRDVSLTNALYA